MTDVPSTNSTTNSGGVTPVWPIFSYVDARAAMTFLADAFGFAPRVVHARDDDPRIVEHAEMAWPGGGGVMVGTAGRDDSPFGRRKPGNDAVHLVCADPDALFARATAAGAEVVRDVADEDYGSRGFTVRDPEGNLWSFGTYAGGPAAGTTDGAETNGARNDDKETFTALFVDWNEAIVANDPDAIGAFAAPDWVFVGENGIFTGALFLESVATGQVSHDFMASEVHDVRVYGDVAVVVARVRNSGAFGGAPFTLDEWTSDVFVRHEGRWLCSLTHLTSVAGGR